MATGKKIHDSHDMRRESAAVSRCARCSRALLGTAVDRGLFRKCSGVSVDLVYDRRLDSSDWQREWANDDRV